jgi:hypothetical protein
LDAEPDYPRFAQVRAALSQMLSAETVVYDWQHIKSKALVIGGAKDTPAYPAQAKHVAESIPGAQLELIENIGHCPQLEAPEIFHAKLDSVPEVPTGAVGPFARRFFFTTEDTEDTEDGAQDVTSATSQDVLGTTSGCTLVGGIPRSFPKIPARC